MAIKMPFLRKGNMETHCTINVLLIQYHYIAWQLYDKVPCM